MDKTKFCKTLAIKIIQERKKKGFSQGQLANLSDTDPVTIWRIENAQISANSFLLYKIIKALDLTLEEFFINFEEEYQ